MEIVTLVIAILALVAAIAAAIGAWRPRAASPTADLAPVLAASEERLRREVGALREVTERTLRESQQLNSNAQMDLSTRLTKAIQDANETSRELMTTRFLEFQGKIGEQQTTVTESLNRFGERMSEAHVLARREQSERFDAFQTLQQKAQEVLAKALEQFSERMSEANATARREQAERFEAFSLVQRTASEELTRVLTDLRESANKQAVEARKIQEIFFEKLNQTLVQSLEAVRHDNEKQLEKMRETVDEKLQKTLNDRLGESFKQVSERLEQVHKGLGEMQALATGVGDLKRVLTNVRSRGTFGEVQLGALLEQVMVAGQYRQNVATVPGSSERVEFAVVLPGRGDKDSSVYLPIDAKFPQEDYLRLQGAYEGGEAVAIETSRKALANRLVQEAATIRSKYVNPPHTTDFALLFLPTEGLFAEALRIDGLVERIRSESHVIVVGPTTLYAVLNSLQMGFRTLAIEKRSSEVWRILGAVKTEFGKFAGAVDAVSKSIKAADKKIDDLAGTRTRVMERTLRGVEALPEMEANEILPPAGEDEDN